MLYDYFQSYEAYFWQWEEEMEVLAIPEAGTIAYREYVLQLLEKLSPQGLPPFGSLLLALTATNPNASSNIGAVYRLVSRLLGSSQDSTFSEAIAFLNLLSEVPEAYKSGRKRILLLQALFQDCHYMTSVKKSARIVHTFRTGNYGRKVVANKKPLPLPHEHFHHDFRTIALLGRKFPDVNAILNKMAALPEIQDDIIPETDTTVPELAGDAFVQQLLDDSKLFPVGSLLKRIWGALNIPFHNTLPSAQPLGGFSDLTNKGDFDRLLVSEFANDDLVFLSRLANNEALYLRREIPPANNNLQRLLLLDVSLRNWGTPKTIAFALTLAIARHPKTDIACQVYAVGDSYQPLSLDTPDAIIEALQLLATSPHAAQGIEQFFKENPSLQHREVIFISAADATIPAAARLALDKYQALFSYWIQTTAQGQVTVYKTQQKGKKQVQTFQLPLEELWRKQPLSAPEALNQKHPSLLPILLPLPQKTKKILATPDGELFLVTQERNLLRLYVKNADPRHKGWELVHERLPYGDAEYEIGLTSDGAYVLLLYSHEKKEITLVNISTGKQKAVPFPHWKEAIYKMFFFHLNQFHLLSINQYWTISPEGDVLMYQPAVHALMRAKNKRVAYLESLKPLSGSRPNILKNVKQVYLNETGNLVLNTHELNLHNGVIKFVRTFFHEKKHEGYRRAKNTFSFADGSKVEVNSEGFAILKSSDHMFPHIYVPLVLDAPLGLATGNSFAGNEYYLKDPNVDVELVHPGRLVVTAISQLKGAAGIGTAEAKKLLDEAPGSMLKNVAQHKARELKRILEKEGGKVVLHQAADSLRKGEFVQLLASDFYRKYVKAFIETIQAHGTGN